MDFIKSYTINGNIVHHEFIQSDEDISSIETVKPESFEGVYYFDIPCLEEIIQTDQHGIMGIDVELCKRPLKDSAKVTVAPGNEKRRRTFLSEDDRKLLEDMDRKLDSLLMR